MALSVKVNDTNLSYSYFLSVRALLPAFRNSTLVKPMKGLPIITILPENFLGRVTDFDVWNLYAVSANRVSERAHGNRLIFRLT